MLIVPHYKLHNNLNLKSNVCKDVQPREIGPKVKDASLMPKGHTRRSKTYYISCLLH